MRRLFIGPKDVTQTLIRMGKTTHVISIIDPDESHIEPPGGLHLCQLTFNDLDRSHLDVINKPANRVNLRLVTRRDVEKALIFASTVPTDKLLAIHCGAGVSRSPAIGLGVVLQDLKEVSGGNLNDKQIRDLLDEFFQRYPCSSPNRLVMEYVEDVLGLVGHVLPRVSWHVANWVPSKSNSDRPNKPEENNSEFPEL